MYTGTGIYSIPEAARLIHVPTQKIRRWLYGHNYSKKSGEERVRVFSEPLWTPQHSKAEFETETIGFNDLLEIRFVAAFVQYGVPLAVVRRCLETAQELYRVDYPMSTGAFKTDGKTIFSEALEKTMKEGALLDLKNRQFAFKAIISQSLYAGIEYDGKRASKWYPQGRRHHVVLDPARQFGSPIVDEVGVPTGVLFASYLAEGGNTRSITQTARVYDVPVKFVEAAIKFEQGLTRTVH